MKENKSKLKRFLSFDFLFMVMTFIVCYTLIVINTLMVNKETGGPVDTHFILVLIAQAIVVAAVAFLLFVYIDENHLKSFNRKINKTVIYGLLILTVLFIYLLNNNIAQFIPVFFVTSLISVLYTKKLSYMMTVCLAVILFLFNPSLIVIIIATITGCIMQAHILSLTSQRSVISTLGILVAFINFVLYFAADMISAFFMSETYVFLDSLKFGAYWTINSFVSVMLIIGLLPLLETLTSNVTVFKIQELSNQNSPLLKRLMTEAPGTYHHSVMVGNLAEAAAEAIGANADLARVASLYHDVGKLKYPQYFMENITGANPHDVLEPRVSADILIAHTLDGEELARKYKLPYEIRQIIREHHGTTCAEFFYVKALNAPGQSTEPIKEEFMYSGPKPSTKESVIIMLADSVEAAVRSLKDKSTEKVTEIVYSVVKKKLEENQFDECDISFRNIKDITDSFLKVIGGYYHERTEYPKQLRKNPYDEKE